MIKSPRRRPVSLVGTLRAGRPSQNRAVAVTLVAALVRRKLFSSVLLAHRRQREATRRRGSQRDTSLSVSPARRRSPNGPSKSRWSAPDVRRLLHHSALQRFRERPPGTVFPPSRQGGRVVPRGMPQGRAAQPPRHLTNYASNSDVTGH